MAQTHHRITRSHSFCGDWFYCRDLAVAFAGRKFGRIISVFLSYSFVCFCAFGGEPASASLCRQVFTRARGHSSFSFQLFHFNNAQSKAALFTLPTSLQFIFLYMLLFALLISYFTPLVLQVFTELQLPTLFFEHQRDTHGKNTIVIALALGLAIAPSIYSLAEDAIYEVPVSLRRASYALGATRLQTLLNVVLKVAYPGILSAVMLGFSRALGETMILLMITGNTPMAEWDLVAGMRALTANLAIELPEAEVGSIHYQVLFLTALLLLVFTMAINTIAELLRLRLRKKYQHG